MNKYQTSSLRRLKAVRRLLDAHSTSWLGAAGIERAATDLDLIISDLEQVIQLQQLGSKPTTAEKTQHCLALQFRLGEACSHLHTLSTDRRLPGVLWLASRPHSRMSQISAEELVAYAELILEQVDAYPAELDALGFSPADRDALEAALEAFRYWMDEPRAVISRRHGQTSRVDDILKGGYAILKQRLDRLMKRYEVSDPAFFSAYRAARKLVHLGVGNGVSAADAA